MKARNLARHPLSGMALLSFVNITLGIGIAPELSSAAEIFSVGDQSGSAAVQELQHSLMQQQELLAMQSEQINRQEQQIGEQSARLQAMEAQLMQLVAAQSGAAPEPSQQPGPIIPIKFTAQPAKLSASSESRATVLEQRDAGQISRDPEEPTEAEREALPGYLPVPGTDAAMKLGGFVKMSIVQSFDQVGSADRFVAGSIPVSSDEAGVEDQANLTARQSRLNLDVRRQSDLGPLRAFMEGDFAGEGDTYRLRHAYGQFRRVLAGKTWSTFVDTQAKPEEIDFEGLNGRINVRQPQLRYFPAIGEHLQLAVALEDPNPDVGGATGLTKVPDVVASIRRTWWNEWHVKTALLLRQIRAQPEDNLSPAEKDYGWGLSVSGRVNVARWGEQDNFLFQLNYGDGIGRYINDLGSVGGQDGVFDPASGELKALPAFGGYLAFQHWWSEKTRSTFVAGLTNVDNFAFQLDDDYHQTKRITANLLFSPISRVDIGAELLWGERINKPDNSGDALQLQFTAKYIF